MSKTIPGHPLTSTLALDKSRLVEFMVNENGKIVLELGPFSRAWTAPYEEILELLVEHGRISSEERDQLRQQVLAAHEHPFPPSPAADHQLSE